MRWLILATLLTGCSSKSTETPTKTSASAVITEYTVRGQLVVAQGKLLHIRHEAIPEFRGATGKVIGIALQ